jgi:hypothetical protein
MTPAVRDIILSNRVAWSFMGDGSRVWDFTRASDGMRINPAGSWETVSTNGLRYDYVRTTNLLRGVLIEPARTNSIRNSTMAGAVVGVIGAGGAWPANGAIGGAAGLTRTVVAVGAENGVDYIDIRLNGTTGATFTTFSFEALSQIAASVGQIWVSSQFMSIVGGATTNIASATLLIQQYDAALAFLSNLASGEFLPLLSPTQSRYATTQTLDQATVAWLVPRLLLTYSSGVAIDITLRLGLPQMERVASGVPGPTTPIRTTDSAATRAVDALSLPIPPGTYSVGVVGGTVLQAGTTYTDTVTVTGPAWDFTWPTAAVTAGERHLQRVSMRRIG